MELDALYNNNYKLIYNYIKKHSWKYIDELNIDEIINKSFLEFYRKKDKKYVECSYGKYICGFAYNIMRNISMYNKRYYDKNIELMDYHYIVHNKADLLDIIIEKENY